MADEPVDDEQVDDEPVDDALTRAQISAAVDHLGWRLVLGTVRTAVAVRGIAEAAAVARVAADVAGPAGDGALEVSLGGERVGLAVQTRALDAVTVRDVALVRTVDRGVVGAGLADGSRRPRPARRDRRRCPGHPCRTPLLAGDPCL